MVRRGLLLVGVWLVGVCVAVVLSFAAVGRVANGVTRSNVAALSRHAIESELTPVTARPGTSVSTPSSPSSSTTPPSAADALLDRAAIIHPGCADDGAFFVLRRAPHRGDVAGRHDLGVLLGPGVNRLRRGDSQERLSANRRCRGQFRYSRAVRQRQPSFDDTSGLLERCRARRGRRGVRGQLITSLRCWLSGARHR